MLLLLDKLSNALVVALRSRSLTMEMMRLSDSTKRYKLSKPDQHGGKKKTIVDISFQSAFFRALIHIFPVSICILLLTLNLTGVFIGPDLKFGSWTTTYSLAAFQGAAKIQVWWTCDLIYERICPEDRPKGVNLPTFSMKGQNTGGKFPNATYFVSP